MSPHADLAALITAARDRSPRSVARVVSLVEEGGPQARAVLASLSGATRQAYVIGLTGAPGVGKSTATTSLVRALRAEGHSVAVLAVDPSSPFSGGAILGDRIRMGQHADDEQVYIRSMASRGHLGGLAAATPQVARLLDALGFDVIIIETVGVGQSEVAIAATADTTIVMLAPGMGDGVQAAKAGILEVGDIYVVNKADRDGTDATVRDLRSALSLVPSDPGGWTPPIHRMVATRDEGVAGVVADVWRHRTWLRESGHSLQRRRARARAEILALAMGLIREELSGGAAADVLESGADEVASHGADSYSVAEHVVRAAGVTLRGGATAELGENT